MLKLSFIGDLTIDIYPKLKKTRLGGASLISAVWAKRLGAEVSILAAIGNKVGSFLGPREASFKTRPFFALCQKEGINSDHIKVLPGSTSQIEIFLDSNGERSFGKWEPGAFANYHLEKKDFDFLKTQDAVVLPVYYKTRHLLDELISIHHPSSIIHHPIVVIDFDDLSQFNKQTEIIEKHLNSIDIVKVGLDIDKDKALIEKLQKLIEVRPRTRTHLVLITLGPNGSLVFVNGKTYRQKAIKIHPSGGLNRHLLPINTTGAGDAFLAGFLISYLKTFTPRSPEPESVRDEVGQNLQKSLILASQTAAKAIFTASTGSTD